MRADIRRLSETVARQGLALDLLVKAVQAQEATISSHRVALDHLVDGFSAIAGVKS
jgi:uncharacterized coiled-coil protein SlyX